jgi:molecular chaperone DnaJ
VHAAPHGGICCRVKDPYEVLGIARNASEDDIKAAFRSLGRKHHPDRNQDDPNAAQRFKEINAAYQLLSDPKKRAMFDRFGSGGLGSGVAGGPFQGSPIDLSELNVDGLFGDLLDALGIRLGERGSVRVELPIRFEEAAFGCLKSVHYERMTWCDSCGGRGAPKGVELKRCDTCMGRGKIRVQQGMFPISVERNCSACNGAGKKPERPCSPCNGSGLREIEARVDVKIPAGVNDGWKHSLEGRGNRSRDRRPGSLEVIVRVEAHELFSRSGDNIHCSLPLTFAQAVLGDEVQIPTLDGKGTLRVPEGTQPGTVLRIRGKGIPRRRVKGRGDQLVEIQVEIPTNLNEEQKAVVKRLADDLGQSVQPQRRTFMDKLKGLFN